MIIPNDDLTKEISIPVGSLPMGLGYQLKGIVEGGSKVEASFDEVVYEDKVFEWNSMVTSSSYGPTLD